MQQSILLIEDEESLARFVELELQHEGYAVVKRFDGREGLDEALRGAYDLILLDIMLPGDDGYTILEQLKSMPSVKDVPVIMVTAKEDIVDKVIGLELGADDRV